MSGKGTGVSRVGEVLGWGGWWQRLKQRSKMSQIVEFRVAMYDVHMYPQRTNIPLQSLYRRALKVSAILGLHYQIGIFHWHYITICGLIRLVKGTYSRKADQSTLVNGGCEYAKLFSVNICELG